METSSVWNPLGQGTRSEEQILFLKFSGANVGGHGRLSKGANISERIKLSRIGLADVFTQTVSMHVSTENEKKIKIFKSEIAKFYFFATAMRKKISLVRRRILYRPSQILKPRSFEQENSYETYFPSEICQNISE